MDLVTDRLLHRIENWLLLLPARLFRNSSSSKVLAVWLVLSNKKNISEHLTSSSLLFVLMMMMMYVSSLFLPELACYPY